ncbi:acetolactate synthase 2 small subunit [uncultured Psychromonas sp.]|uniref:acetolactate synthase 2 small subunit n=1 Tax=uncultured Psychromonas sp. TaxID=173974 RepID=UPI0026315A5A|nr:acetolactate synthase 2 small subunit [uncultured Psychromonas sp.]
MINALTVEAKNSPEFLERLLRVCRHRGFTIQSINAEVNNTLQTTQINLTVFSERDITLLTKQIEKVVGVIEITLLQQPENIKVSA